LSLELPDVHVDSIGSTTSYRHIQLVHTGDYATLSEKRAALSPTGPLCVRSRIRSPKNFENKNSRG
ncbi:MAG: hypothetical protein ACI364_00730, partial [Coriobacteriales bacterium]